MFKRTVLAASLACILAVPALAQSSGFDYSWSARQKFAWAQANYDDFCPIPKSRNIRFENLPGWMQVGLTMATEDMVINGIIESCGKELNATTAAAYAPR